MQNTMITLGVAALVGAAAGADAAIWGMYKDAAHEGFRWPRFARSIAIASAAAIVVQHVLDLELPGAGAMLVLFGLAYAAERAVVEVWKTFVRAEDQSKYAIPMQFAIGLKFFRSPSLTTAAALLLFPLTSSALLAAIAAVGYERAASENYRTFFFPPRPRGKFAGKPVTHPVMLLRRHRFVPAYLAIRVALVWCALGACS